MRTPIVAGLVSALLLLAGCADEPSEPPGPAATPSDPRGASPTDTATPVWNPCDGLDADAIGRAVGVTLTVDRGDPGAPQCTLTPAAGEGPTLDANYLVFPAGLDAAWRTMGAPTDGTVTEPRIAGAESARLVVAATAEGLAVTGFVQNGELIQVVNAVDPRPYDRAAVLRGVRLTMTQLSAGAAAGPS